MFSATLATLKLVLNRKTFELSITTTQVSVCYQFLWLHFCQKLSTSAHGQQSYRKNKKGVVFFKHSVGLYKDGSGHIQRYICTPAHLNTTTPAYLGRHLQTRNCVRNLRSSALLCFFRLSPQNWLSQTWFTFRYSSSVPAIWNSLPRTVLESPSLTVFKSRLIKLTF